MAHCTKLDFVPAKRLAPMVGPQSRYQSRPNLAGNGPQWSTTNWVQISLLGPTGDLKIIEVQK